MTSDQTSPRLPPWPTIRRSYARYAVGFGAILRIAWPWLVLGALLPAPAMALRMAGLLGPVGTTAITVMAQLVVVLAGFSIAVAWHRYLILDQAPAASLGNFLTSHFWRFTAVAVLIGLMVWLPMWLPLLLSDLLPDPSFAGPMTQAGLIALALPALLVRLAIFALLCRLCLAMPASAIGADGLGLSASWHATRGNLLRLMLCVAACVLLPCAVFGRVQTMIYRAILIQDSAPVLPSTQTLLLLQGTINVVQLLIVPLAAGFLSIAYLQLGPARGNVGG
ncbi:hypothetical protein [Bradyrhizobium sp. HKCCYLS20291]|uniref:hypothetical protein n=1 Tax=Bradyrhizobium sp. HKCCYLS20291 TaxID=3420766 RepID=UPI003EB9582D